MCNDNGDLIYSFLRRKGKCATINRRVKLAYIRVLVSYANIMNQLNYLISVTYRQNSGVDVILAILNIAGRVRALLGSSSGVVSKGLWIIPNGKKDKQELITELQAVPSIHKVSIIALSKPIKRKELAEVRELFAGYGLDASSVTDNELLLFINDKIQGQCNYFINEDFDREQAKISIKCIEDHPHFSPDWLKKNNHIEEEWPDRELTIDDIEFRTIEVVITEERSENDDI